MVLASLLFFLPAFALSSKDSVAIVPAEDLKVCEYFDARIVRLREIVNKELGPDVDIGSDLYTTLEESKLCDTVGYVAIPECVANNGGDECVARKTSELIRKTLRAAMKAEKIKDLPSGEKFFATCKHIGYKNVLKTFKSARTLMSAECGLPGLGGSRSRRSLDLLPALLLGGSYDPSSIWFQYFLCKDIDLYCYFFTQGWTQGQYGQYYLYDNLLDDTTGLFAGATDSNLATIALLGGLGGGIGQPSGYYPSYGGHSAPAGRKRRDTTGEDDDETDRKRREVNLDCDDESNQSNPLCRRRKRSTVECETDDTRPHCLRRKRSSTDECESDDTRPHCLRRKRSTECETDDTRPHCLRRKRSTNECETDDSRPHCLRRKRSTAECDTEKDPNCSMRKRRSTERDCAKNDAECNKRKRREACDACKDNPDSLKCSEC